MSVRLLRLRIPVIDNSAGPVFLIEKSVEPPGGAANTTFLLLILVNLVTVRELEVLANVMVEQSMVTLSMIISVLFISISSHVIVVLLKSTLLGLLMVIFLVVVMVEF